MPKCEVNNSEHVLPNENHASLYMWYAICYILRSTVQDDYCSCMYYCYLQVDFEESKVVGRFVVKPNVDAELDDSEWQSFVSSHQEFGIKFNNG